jgi:hypothetical protein
MYRLIIGKYSLHTLSNDNCIRIINFVCSKHMVVTNTLFNLKDIHKMTWRSPDGQTHIQICQLHESNVMDVRTFRGDNILVDSEH